MLLSLRRFSALSLLILASFGTIAACSSDSDDPGPGASSPAPSTTRISAASGGTVSDPSGNATLTIPAGALAEDTDISLATLSATAETVSGIYDFGPDGLAFLIPATLAVKVDAAAIGDKQVALAIEKDGSYVKLAGSIHAAGVVSAPIEHFSKFAVVEKAGATEAEPCAGQECEPVVIAKSDAIFPKALAVSDTHVFWTQLVWRKETPDSVALPFGGVYKAPLEGGEPVALFTMQTPPNVDIALDETHAYAIGDAGLFKVSQAGGDATKMLEFYGAGCSLRVHQGNIYWLPSASMPKALHRLPVEGGAPSELAKLSDHRCSFAIARESIYLSTGLDISRVPITGGEAERILPLGADAERASQLLADSSHLYWVDGEKLTIKSMPQTGGTPTALAKLTPGDSGELMMLAHRGLVLVGGHLYWWDPKTGNIMQTPASGGKSVIAVAGQENVKAMTSDATSIYWSMYDDQGGTLMKMRR